MTNFWLNIGKKIFYLIILKLKVSSFTTDWIYHQQTIQIQIKVWIGAHEPLHVFFKIMNKVKY